MNRSQQLIGKLAEVRSSPSFPRAGSEVDGLRVDSNVPNTSSIQASLTDYTVLPGIRKVPIKAFGGPKTFFYAKNDFDRAQALADQIAEGGWISPLIVVVDSEGPYILEGAHRFVALFYLKKKHFPAMVVLDNED